MLNLCNITKSYGEGSSAVQALRGISVSFRESEFVSVLGPSGCGKTTLLNIIGGLDQYTSGDLVINGVSTRKYKSGDWDTYRNHSVGFVFQSYNLIPHQSVLANVELALTLSGVSRTERRRRATEALERVGLGDQLHKKPNQMSGGQMQRVAIARAIVNDPDILLADEPTGALDTATSRQIMDILKEIASDRLVIMVTHNPELAEQYATRIIRLRDGEITDDSMPYTPEKEEQDAGVRRAKKPSMGFLTALSLSFKNLLTKKGRTILTAFAGSIGIIGIALILSLSNGINQYIERVQEDTLSAYPLTIEAETMDMTSLITSLTDSAGSSADHERDAVYSDSMMGEFMDSLTNVETRTNDLQAFSEYIEQPDSALSQYASNVQYSYETQLDIYAADTSDGVLQVNPSVVMQEMMGTFYNTDTLSGMATGASDIWTEMLDNEELLKSQYDVVAGRWPEAYNEVVLLVNENNEVSEVYLYALGLQDPDELTDLFKKAMNGETVETQQHSWSYDDILGLRYKLVLPTDYYEYDEQTGTWQDIREDEERLKQLVDDGVELEVVGILRPNEEAVATALSGVIGYTAQLTQHVLNAVNDSEIVKAQQADPDSDVFTGLPFDTGESTELTDAQKAQDFKDYAGTMTVSEKSAIYAEIAAAPGEGKLAAQTEAVLSAMSRADMESSVAAVVAQQMELDSAAAAGYAASMSDEELTEAMRQILTEQQKQETAQSVRQQLEQMTNAQIAAAFDAQIAASDDSTLAALYDVYMPPTVSDATYEENLDLLGVADPDCPSAINIYAQTFEDKDGIAAAIEEYNRQMEENGEEDKTITYTDYVGILMSSITTIINVISYVLIAFVSISLIVSSIMIGIITYISVLERTKEIGILRSIGASRRDISRVFNAETLLIGFTAGLLGIAVTVLLCIPLSAIVKNYTGIAGLAQLPAMGGVILVAISMLLTFIAGLVPSRMAAKKDPVVALRSE